MRIFGKMKPNKLYIVANRTTPEIDFSNIRLNREISQGSFGEVFVLFDKKSQKTYAIKIFKDTIDKSQISSETKNCKKIENIARKIVHFIKFYGEIEFQIFDLSTKNLSPIKFGLIFDLAEGSLDSLLEQKKRQNQNFQLSEAIDILNSINENLLILQQEIKSSHMDVKPKNIVYEKVGNKTRYTLIDFGESKILDTIGTLSKMEAIEVVGTVFYLSPEMNFARLNNLDVSNINTYKSDIYSLAISIVEILVKDKLKIFPEPGRGKEKKMDPSKIKIGPYDQNIKTCLEYIKNFVSFENDDGEYFCGILEEMLKYDFHDRPSLIEIELKIKKLYEKRLERQIKNNNDNQIFLSLTYNKNESLKIKKNSEDEETIIKNENLNLSQIQKY